MSKSNKELALQLTKLLGAKENVLRVTSCMTRCRVDVSDVDKVEVDEIKKIEEVQGIVIESNQVQVVLGPGKCTKVAREVAEVLNISCDMMDSSQLKNGIKSKNATPFKLFLKKISSIFIPILPAIIACGLIMGINNVIIKLYPSFGATPIGGILSAMGSSAFTYLPILVGVCAATVFGGSMMIGGTMAALLQMSSLAKITLFGITLSPGRGGIIAVLLVVAFSSFVEKKVRNVVPDSISIFATPLLTVLISGFVSLILLQPIGGIISDSLTNGVKLALNRGGIIAGFIMAVGWLPLVMTGLHQSITPLHAELIQTIGNTPLLPVFAMVGPGQIGAVLYVYTKTKNKRLKKVILSGIPVQLMGIGEPLIYGVTLPLMKPFIAACLSAGVGGAFCVALGLNSIGMGLSGLPLAMMLNKPLIYIGIMIIVAITSFFLTKIIGFEDIIEE
jgi:PTS system sucrose-specific IIC component